VPQILLPGRLRHEVARFGIPLALSATFKRINALRCWKDMVSDRTCQLLYCVSYRQTNREPPTAVPAGSPIERRTGSTSSTSAKKRNCGMDMYAFNVQATAKDRLQQKAQLRFCTRRFAHDKHINSTSPLINYCSTNMYNLVSFMHYT
jgi:hypothetical protein